MNVHSEKDPAKPDKRRQIMEAALSLLSDEGFHGASMAKLAKTAGVPVGTIYRHFAGKEELIHDLYIEIKQERFTAMLDGYDAEAPLRARFDTFWGNSFDYCLSHPREFRFAEQYAFSPFLKDVSKAIQIDIPPELGAFYADGYRDGIFKSLPPQILTALISGPLNALVTRALAGIVKLDPPTRQDVMDACWDAITL
ncbi:MAG: TetR/AcrR family transcriptional regulator [Parvibaculum sp.]|nr:TetR/AcrR family transcriptional regulator [Parvibaculum sp.]